MAWRQILERPPLRMFDDAAFLGLRSFELYLLECVPEGDADDHLDMWIRVMHTRGRVGYNSPTRPTNGPMSMCHQYR